MAIRAIEATMSPMQLAYLCDPAKNKAALCGRRAGKTTVATADLTITALRHPETLSAYITLTRRNAKQLIWPQLRRLNAKHRLGIEFNVSDLMAHFPNGSRIWLGGANNEAEIEKFRGFAYKKVLLDECASFGSHFDSLTRDVIEPGLLDGDGTLGMLGSPGPICAGAFHDATTDPAQGFSVHHWTVLDNPFIPHAAEWLEARRIARGWNENDPRYLREWKGLWISDLNSLVYRYTAANSDYSELPGGQSWEYVLGVDFGYSPDPCAFVVLAFSRYLPDVYLVEADESLEMIPASVAERIAWYQTRYRFNSIVCDAGGLGKAFVEEFRKRYSLPCTYAEKSKKHEYIALLNSDLETGRFRIKRDSPVAAQYGQVQWDEKRKKEDKRYPNDLTDAALYAWREAKHFCHTPVDPPARTVDERLQREAKRLEQAAINRRRNKRSA